MKKKLQNLVVLVLFFTLAIAKAQVTFTDSRDGNVYSVVQIGTQVWMAENLRYLPSVSESTTESTTDSYFYVYGYNGTDIVAAKSTTNYSTYGVLYNWPAVMHGANSSSSNPSNIQGVCPNGWHVPSVAEWNQLATFLGGSTVAGGALKQTGTMLWNSPNTGATNSSGFSARPSGKLDSWDGFDGLGNYGHWWTATEDDEFNSTAFDLGYNYSQLFSEEVAKSYGFCVRCISNTPLSNPTNEARFGLSVYPNPASNFINISISKVENISVTIFDMIGKQVFLGNFMSNLEIIDVSLLSKGIYLLDITINEYKYQIKFVKE